MKTRWRIGAAFVVIVTSLSSSLYAAAPLREFPYAKQTNLAPGAYRFVFSLYSSPTAATSLWTSETVPLAMKTPLLLYALGSGTNKIAASIDFSQQLYVKVVKTHPPPSVVVANRERYPIAPYALSLRPGAAVSGKIYDGAVLALNNADSSTGGGYALSAVNYSGNTWRPAIYGENRGASAGVYGRSNGWHAVVGWSDASAWAGVHGYNAGSGYGGWFDSASDHLDLVLGGAVGRINTDPTNENSDLILSSNNNVVVRLDNDSGENGIFSIVNSAGTTVLQTDESGNVWAAGTITPNSDRNLKDEFSPVDSADILARVAALPVQRWKYKIEQPGIRHIGPMAQDFRAAFGLGINETTIATVDADGVALAAIQGLNTAVTRQRAALDAQAEEIGVLKSQLAAQRLLLERLLAASGLGEETTARAQ